MSIGYGMPIDFLIRLGGHTIVIRWERKHLASILNLSAPKTLMADQNVY